MDLNATLTQFYGPDGSISLDPRLTLPGLAEMIYQADAAHGGAQRRALRFWHFDGTSPDNYTDYTREDLNTAIKAVAVRLGQIGRPGQPVAILAGNSPEYIIGFLGAMYAGMTPVPLYDPREPGHADHLRAVFADADPRIVLTNTAAAKAVRNWFADLPGTSRPRILAIDALPTTLASQWVNPLTDPTFQAALANSQQAPLDQAAFLQYTSGSTRTPAGVILTHRSILSNVLQIFAAGQLALPMRLVSWLPLHHDMGIILAAFVTILGLDHEMMAPRDFIQQPSRWISQLSRRGDDDATVYTVVPNFALDLAVRYAADADVDLSGVDGVILGSEPVTQRSVEAFAAAFGPKGLLREALRPSYGLAEASLLVSTPQRPERPVITHFDRDQLAAGHAEVAAESGPETITLLSNGQAVAPAKLIVVDPQTRQEVPDGTVGELWNYGDNLAAGYLGRPEESQQTFHNELAGRLESGSRAGDAPDAGWLATGDLGTIIDDEVYITGRLKDLIVIAGRNHYPQDIEDTVGAASQRIDALGVAAFSVPGDDVEKLIILAERAADAPADDADADQAAAAAIRTAVSQRHGLAPAEVIICAPGDIARSSSAKIARRVARNNYLSRTQD